MPPRYGHRAQTSTWGQGCRGKVAYTSRKHAIGALRTVVQNGRADSPSTLEEYRCPACGKWHLGNRGERAPKPLRRVIAAVGDVVEIHWRTLGGAETVERHEAPVQPPGTSGYEIRDNAADQLVKSIDGKR